MEVRAVVLGSLMRRLNKVFSLSRFFEVKFDVWMDTCANWSVWHDCLAWLIYQKKVCLLDNVTSCGWSCKWRKCNAWIVLSQWIHMWFLSLFFFVSCEGVQVFYHRLQEVQRQVWRRVFSKLSSNSMRFVLRHVNKNVLLLCNFAR